MGIVVEYAGRKTKPQWLAPAPFKWNYTHFGNSAASANAAAPDETFTMLFEKQNAALDGFNQWTINGAAYPLNQMMADRPSISAKASATASACATPATTSTPSTSTATPSS